MTDKVKQNAHSIDNIRRPINQFELDNDCIWVHHLDKKYGHNWHELNLDYLFYKSYKFVKNSDICLIEQYVKDKYKHFENSVLDYIRSFYDGEVVRDSNKYINPYELDFYFPDLKLAIECNGSWWHSIEVGIYDKDYHLMKTKMCKDKSIRLVHLFESNWENFKLRLKQIFTNTEPIYKNNIITLDLAIDNYFAYDDCTIVKTIKPQLIKSEPYSVYDCGKLIVVRTVY